MLKDTHNRIINYLRISVTDKCNYRCTYCMPATGIPLKHHDQILSYESIALIAHHAGRLGCNRVRVTGGEPLVKKNIESLIWMLRLSGKFKEITMTTNAALLTERKAKELKEAGLTRINISLDTLDSDRFREFTRGGNIEDVFRGIEAAKRAQLHPIKINMIVFAETTAVEIQNLQSFCQNNGLILQRIKHFSLYDRDLNQEFDEQQTYDRPQPCALCNRLRLTADGYLKSCLFSDKEVKVDLNNIEKSICQAVALKPLHGTACVNRLMCQIGG